MQESFWRWQCSDKYIISLFPTSLHLSPFSPFLISPMVSIDVKHHVYLLSVYLKESSARTSRGIRTSRNVSWQALQIYASFKYTQAQKWSNVFTSVHKYWSFSKIFPQNLYRWSCVKVKVAVFRSSSLMIVFTASVDVKQHWTWSGLHSTCKQFHR